MPTTTDPVQAPSARLLFLDWVRIIAFFLLILYHVGMYYVSWDWHVKSTYAGDAIEGLMMLTSPWRLALLFMVAGVASAAMLAQNGGGFHAGRAALSFVQRRSWRLLLPLLFGMAVIVPPQPFCEVIEKFAYHGSYGDFLQLYFHNDRRFVTGPGAHLVMPTWNHLWFVAYLWVYSMLLAGGFALAGMFGSSMLSAWQRAGDSVGAMLSGWRLLVLPTALLAAIRLGMLDAYPSTHALFGDWYNHALYGSVFLLGALLARQTRVWSALQAQRFAALGLALACWAMLKVYFSLPDDLLGAGTLLWLKPVQRVVYALGQWTAMVAACGFARRHLDFDSAKRRYLTEAVFPVYIVHQTLIVVMAHYLKPVHLSPLTEGVILVVLTLCGSFGIFEVVRRVGVLRPLFGLGTPVLAGARAATRVVVIDGANETAGSGDLQQAGAFAGAHHGARL